MLGFLSPTARPAPHAPHALAGAAGSRNLAPRRWPNLFTLLILVLVAANYFGTFADLDFAWQIRTGQQILEQGTLRIRDVFTYTIAGERLPDFEWLYEVILYGLWQAFGYGGLKLLRVALVAAPLLILALRLRKEGIRWHGVALCLFVAIFVLAPVWNLRPLYCTTIGLSLLAWWLHDCCSSTHYPPPTTHYSNWWLPVLMLLWGNLHPGVIAGQALLLGAIGWEWLNRRLRWNPPLDRTALRRLTVIGGVALLASCICPDPLERLLYPFKPELAHPIMRIFVEMQPTYVFIGKPPFAIALVYLVAGLVLASVIVRFRHYRFWEVMLLAGVAGLANVAVRSMQDWLVIMLALGMPHLAALLAKSARRDRRRWWVARLLRTDGACKRLFASPLFRFQPGYLSAALAGFVIVSLMPPLSRRMPLQDAPDWPVAAVDRISQLGLHGRFFSPPDHGAYLTWRLGARVQVYTDTRGFFFPPVFLEDSTLIPKAAGDWRQRLQRVLDEYGADYFLLETTGERGELWRLLRDAGAEPIYLDERWAVLNAEEVRRGLPTLATSARDSE